METAVIGWSKVAEWSHMYAKGREPMGQIFWSEAT